MEYREFTKSFIFHDFDDVLKDPFRYVHILDPVPNGQGPISLVL